MDDVLTYLEAQQASFAEEPLNAVDSALLAQFCMVRGEGLMPRLCSGEHARAASREDANGRLGGLRARLARWRHRGVQRGGALGAGAASVEAAPSAGAASVDGAAHGVAAGAQAGEAAPPSSAATRDRAEMMQDAAAPTEPVRFADLLRSELFPTMFSGMHAAQMKQQLFWMAASPRFRDLLIYDHAAAFDEALDLQFAATTYVCPGQFAYVGFRGTDTTLTGWREDFNMAYMVPVPAQDMAARYLAAVAADERLPERIVLGGHSKGGNLAEYAALTAAPEVQRRIAHLYNHDGPGFMPGTFSPTDYEPLSGRMTKQVPADSMVGILLESAMPVEVVQATGRGFEQHSVFRWEVRPAAANGSHADFALLPALPERTQRRAEALRRWLSSLDGSERKKTVDALFNAVEAAGITDAAQLFEGGREWAILRDGVMRAPMADRSTMLGALRGLTRAFSDVTAERNNARRASRK